MLHIQADAEEEAREPAVKEPGGTVVVDGRRSLFALLE